MLVGPYLSHPLTSYMKNARYIVKTATASSAELFLHCTHTHTTVLLLGKILRRSLLICCTSAGLRKNAGVSEEERKMRQEPALLTA